VTLPEWWHTLWSYRLHDLLMFSPLAHARLFELVNQQTWPLPLAAALLPLGVLAAILHGGPRPRAAAAMTVAAALASVAEWHLRQSLAGLLWLAPGWAVAFGLSALVWLGVACRAWRAASGPAAPPQQPERARRALAWLLATLALAWPLLAPLQGRPWLQAEVAGLAPDPTVLLALALLLNSPARGGVWALQAVVPLAWCGFAGLMLLALGAPQAGVLPLAAAATLALQWRRHRPPASVRPG
jgi:hypothetical protein